MSSEKRFSEKEVQLFINGIPITFKGSIGVIAYPPKKKLKKKNPKRKQ